MENENEVPVRSSLAEIPVRHRQDRWQDAVFIIAAVILTAVSIGAVTSKAAGHVTEKQWGVSMVDGPDLGR